MEVLRLNHTRVQHLLLPNHDQLVNEGKSLHQYNVQLWKKGQKIPLEIQDRP
jgi:hypothetical protein